MSGSKIKDQEQEYQYSLPFVTPSGHELTFYDTPKNERLIVKHASGSRIEFKADGSMFFKCMKDMRMDMSLASEQGSENSPADMSTFKCHADMTLQVKGRLSIQAASIDIEAGEYIKSYAGTDYTIQGNNIIEKATEDISLEGTKAIHVDTKNYTERSVSHVQEEGTKEGVAGVAPTGGQSVTNVQGHAVIRNMDPNGGITIQSAGYLNLVCGQERVDLVGAPSASLMAPAGTKAIPEALAVAMPGCVPQLGTYTLKVAVPTPPGAQNKSIAPGDMVISSAAGRFQQYGTVLPSNSGMPGFSMATVIPLGNVTRQVMVGNEFDSIMAGTRNRLVGKTETIAIGAAATLTCGGAYKVTAPMIFLN